MHHSESVRLYLSVCQTYLYVPSSQSCLVLRLLRLQAVPLHQVSQDLVSESFEGNGTYAHLTALQSAQDSMR